jgi:HPt (histidine-containing phosphotransfer) domain-containing protein
MERVLDEGDLKRLTQVAHSLKGASGNLGAGAVAEVAQRIEAAGQSGQGEGIGEMLVEIRSRYAAAEAALKALPVAPAASL